VYAYSKVHAISVVVTGAVALFGIVLTQLSRDRRGSRPRG
jgi:hypothetical protein